MYGCNNEWSAYVGFDSLLLCNIDPGFNYFHYERKSLADGNMTSTYIRYHKLVLNTQLIFHIVTCIYSCVFQLVLFCISPVLISLHDFDFTEEKANKHSATEPQRLVCVDCRRVVHDGYRLCHCVWCRYRKCLILKWPSDNTYFHLPAKLGEGLVVQNFLKRSFL